MIFLFETENSAKLLWNTEGASGTLHIPTFTSFSIIWKLRVSVLIRRRSDNVKGTGRAIIGMTRIVLIVA